MVQVKHVEAILSDGLVFKWGKTIISKNSTNNVAKKHQGVTDKSISDVVFWILAISKNWKTYVVQIISPTKDTEEMWIAFRAKFDLDFVYAWLMTELFGGHSLYSYIANKKNNQDREDDAKSINFHE